MEYFHQRRQTYTKMAIFFLMMTLFLSSFVDSSPILSKSYNKLAMYRANTLEGCTANYTCLGEGDKCVGNLGDKSGCQDKQCCGLNLKCDPTSKKCQTNNIGEACSDSKSCYDEAIFSNDVACTGGVCAYVYFIGDGCKTNADCANGITCDSSTSTCQGFSAGQTCNDIDQCAFGLYCKYSAGVQTCAQAPTLGQSCAPGTPCAPGLTCSKNTCQEAFSVAAGQVCEDNEACGEDLYCDFTNGTGGNGICNPVTTSLISCTTNADCPATGSSCVCSPITGESFCDGTALSNLDPCVSELQDVAMCMVKNNCSAYTDSPMSCTYSNCGSELKKSQSCFCPVSKTMFGDCFYNQYCSGGMPGWGIFLIIFAVVIVLVLIGLAAFFVYRRRRIDYNSI